MPSPLTSLNPHHIFPRAAPCSPGGMPILYKEYLGDLCPPANNMDSNGNCPVDFHKNCVAYCEVRQIFTYG